MRNKKNLQYQELTKEEIDRPLEFINEFCNNVSNLEEFRRDTIDLIKSACSKEKFGESEDYFYNYRCLLKFLEAGHIFFKRKKDLSISSEYRVNLIKTDYRTLSDKELDNISTFFHDLFTFKSLRDWRLTFSRIAEYAYRSGTIDEVIEDGSTLIILRDYTEKLIEAIYLIHHAQTLVCFPGVDTPVNSQIISH